MTGLNVSKSQSNIPVLPTIVSAKTKSHFFSGIVTMTRLVAAVTTFFINCFCLQPCCKPQFQYFVAISLETATHRENTASFGGSTGEIPWFLSAVVHASSL